MIKATEKRGERGAGSKTLKFFFEEITLMYNYFMVCVFVWVCLFRGTFFTEQIVERMRSLNACATDTM